MPAIPSVETLRARLVANPRLADVTLAVGVFVILGAVIRAEQGGLRAPDTAAYPAVFVLSSLLLFRRRIPLTVLFLSVGIVLSYKLAGYPDIGLGLPLAPAFYSAAEQHRLRWPVTIVAFLVFLLVGAAVGASYVRLTDENVFSLLIHTLAPEVALMAAVIALGESVRSRREAAHRSGQLIEASAEQERTLARALAATERAEIARDLHDSLGHQATVVFMHTDVAAEALPGNPEVAQKALGVISSTSQEMMRGLRETVRTLREHEVRRPLVSIAALEKTVFADSPLDIEADINPDLRVHEAAEAAAYRIVQEALTNVSKHSAAGSARVTIREREAEIEVVVEDPGPRRSTPHPVSSGVGILGIRERVAALGGSIEARPWESGFRVRALLPAEQPAVSEKREMA